MTNPLLADWSTPFGIAPFDAIRDDDFSPALDAALSQARAAVAAIADNPEPPSFANTVEALELADETLGRVLSTFYTLAGADTNDARNALQREFSPKLAAYGSDVSMNPALFARIEALWEARESLGLTDEQMRVLTLTRRGFVRAGAQLEGEARDRLKAIKERLAVLATEFGQNLLKDESDWHMDLPKTTSTGLPDFAVAAARAAGEEKGAPGPVVTTSRSLIVPFLQFSPRRDLRERAYEAWTSRGARDGATDNRAIAAEILRLREERARLLGYPSFADYKLETEMAKTPDAVRDLLMRVWARRGRGPRRMPWCSRR
jgi:peptidyl-dipeptidase Dcp